VPGRRLVKNLRGYTDNLGIMTLRFSPDSRTLALTGYRRGPKLLMTQIRDTTRNLLGWKPKYDHEILVLEAATGRRLARAVNSTRPFYSPDGTALATQEPDGSTRLRDIDTVTVKREEPRVE